ncbi:hypothetical protein PFICI_01839 [Pestalotiopsis fici W106-1]|uniref:Zn(2)-C6 fungal-type domain-containing protein n=1 Tax=Pestalotiopsis fici (strain W106-1 / CGMCC3.15140) TaxID=1229662 RepID=W3XRY7_PESFW|nr:uncharacterized protein PFICI_01839 [Pestalotiopsis fici W106-1]ETS88011.1 hypothetical protein PFICI_01839 [Pestalotiopsis fici W106-1]
MHSTERTAHSGSLRSIAPKTPRAIDNVQSSSKLFQRPPRKLDKEKCDNCRQAKQKCIEKGPGCQRCFKKGLTCSGRYKASNNSPTSSTVASHDDIVHVSPGSRSEWQEATSDEELFSTPDSDAGFQQCPPVQSHTSKVEDFTGEDIDQDVKDALDELRGLNIGLDMADTLDDEQEVESFAPEIGVTHTTNSAQPLPPCDWDELYEAFIAKYGYPPSKRPDFMGYLRRLRSSDSGLVECPSCRMNKDGEFKIAEIKNHFRYHHVGDIAYADNDNMKPKVWAIVRNLAAGFEAGQIIVSLRDTCEAKREEYFRRQTVHVKPKPNLPSVLLLLSQLRIVCNGQLVCISPRCSLEPFEPSWDALREHYESSHANDIIETDPSRVIDVEDHLKKHEYSIARKLEKAESIRVAWNRKGWTWMDRNWINVDTSEPMADLERIAFEASTYRRIPQTRQWRLVKDLNRLFRTRYKQFVLDTARSSSAELGVFADDLGSTLPSAKRLRRLATKTFEKVLRGMIPNTFLEMLAFGMLSESMTTVMRQQGVPSLGGPTLADHLAWANCIQNQRERPSYDLFACWLKDNFSMNSNGSPYTAATWSAEHDISIHENMKRHVLNLMGARRSDYSFNFSAFLKLDIFADRTTGKKAPETVGKGGEVTATPQKINAQETPKPNVNVKHQLMTLRSNVIFVRVYLFMIYITDQGVLLIYLGNQERQCRVFSSGNHTATAYSILRTTEEMKINITDPLLRDAQQWDRCASKIFKAAETMLDFGQVWRLEELHRQMVLEVERSVEESTLRRFLLNRISQQCFAACGLIKPACENYNTCSVCQCTTSIS